MSLVLALPVALMAQAVSAPAWLAGCWQLQAGNRETIEMWTAPAGGLMLGASRTLVNGALREYEQIVIKLEGGKLVYTASPSGQRTTSFSSTAVTDSSFTVENLQHDFPQRIIYRRRGTDSLIARIEGPSPDGRTRGFDYAMRRTSCDGQAGREGYITTDDSVRLYYRIVGDGPETVIVPVGLYLETLLEPLARPGRRLVFYDPRHRGRSGRGDLSRATLDRQIADLEQLRAALKIDRMAIIGWSGYGMEMAVYTIRHPDRVTRLVQVAPVPPAARIFAQAGGDGRAARTDTAALAALERRFRAGEFATDGAAYCRARERLTAPANFVDPTLVARVPDVCRWENEWPSNLGPYFDAFLPSLGDFDWRDQIARVSIPRLVIHGREDGIPLAGARAWVEGFPAARLLVLSPAGHFPMLERPAEFFPAVNAFLAGDWPSGATAGYHDAWPQWSRDGGRVVFASTRDGDWEIYVGGPAGENAARLTRSPGRDAHPVFLPDGKRIVFQSPRGHTSDAQVDLYVMDADGTNQRRIVSAAGFNGVPVPSPNGEWIAFQRGSPVAGGDYHWDLYLVDSTGRRERRLTNQSWSSQVPTWSPDGRELAFYANPAGPDKLFIMNLSSGAVRPVTAGGTASDNAPAWSPDGRFLAFVSTRDGSRDLYRVEIATNRVQRLTRGLSIWAQPSWSPDGQRIIVSAKADGMDRLVIVSADGR